jgi:uncharacterized protein (TIGR02246 family)
MRVIRIMQPRAPRVHRPRARVALALAALALAGCAGAARAPAPETARAEIEAMMARSAEAWNRGDLDAFMEDYVPGEEATYVGRSGLLRGRAAIRAVYAPRFEPGAPRDSLSFELRDVDALAASSAHVIAWYVLSRGDSVTARGPTSLLMRRGSDGRWRIVHDHSS